MRVRLGLVGEFELEINALFGRKMTDIYFCLTLLGVK